MGDKIGVGIIIWQIYFERRRPGVAQRHWLPVVSVPRIPRILRHVLSVSIRIPSLADPKIVVGFVLLHRCERVSNVRFVREVLPEVVVRTVGLLDGFRHADLLAVQIKIDIKWRAVDDPKRRPAQRSHCHSNDSIDPL